MEANHPNQITLPGGHALNRAYDDLKRLQSMNLQRHNGPVLWSQTYGLTDAGNIDQITVGGASATAQVKTYGYDARDQILAAMEPLGGGGTGTLTYDPAGNRQSITKNQGPSASGGTKDYTVNPLNQITSDGTFDYTYDANGSMISKSAINTQQSEIWSYAYNAEGRLSHAVKNGTPVGAYQYDVFNRRVRKETAEGVIYFLYNAQGLIAEYNESGQEIRAYGWRPNSTWGTDPVFLRTNDHPPQAEPRTVYYVNDHLGTPHRLINSAGDIVWSATYDTFGRATVEGNPSASGGSSIENFLRFPGQYEDVETGWHYNFHRYYLPEVGSYNGIDPIKSYSNWYSYSGSNSLRYVDNLGLATIILDGESIDRLPTEISDLLPSINAERNPEFMKFVECCAADMIINYINPIPFIEITILSDNKGLSFVEGTGDIIESALDLSERMIGGIGHLIQPGDSSRLEELVQRGNAKPKKLKKMREQILEGKRLEKMSSNLKIAKSGLGTTGDTIGIILIPVEINDCFKKCTEKHHPLINY